ncbi:protein SPMIP7-like [Watersipora subatra]|uniref:protein SPMIP7-like n=1 Tax=Watersipora subatra TaxID=2589382 RepID=UPI00355C6D9D
MAQIVSLGPTLSDSTFKTRPHFKSYIQTDQNAGLDAVEAIEAKRRARQLKFPSMSGQKTPKSLEKPLTDPGFIKWNDEGDHRSTGPSRFYGNLIDPVSGFLSAGADVHRNTGVTKLKNFIHVSENPQHHVPRQRTSIRMAASAPQELQRETKQANVPPSLWNSRKTLDISTRAKVGGWTSDEDPRKAEEANKSGSVDKGLRDKLALKYMYKSSTEQQYHDVPWDNMLAPKINSAVSTMEPKPDQVDQRYRLKRYVPTSEEHQLVGRSWDWFQTRNGYYKNPQWIDYTSPCPRAQHIPLYGGCVGADNLDGIDNQAVKFDPYTVKRVNIPREAETSHRPNIPGYAGCTLYRSKTMGAAPAPSVRFSDTPEKSSTPKAQTTTGTVHQSLPADAFSAAHKRDATMSKMITTVPPCNPFNKIDKMPQKLKV